MRGLAGEYPLALVTNGIAAVQNKRFAASPITPFFRSIVISEEAGVAKPDPRIFRPALEKLGVAAGDVLYVGDSVTSDMAAARNAGMDFCWLNPKGLPCPAEHAPTFIVREISEIPDLLTRPDPDKETIMHPIEKRSLEHKPFHWLTFLLEMVMIVFSILLALNLESWREGRKEREHGAQRPAEHQFRDPAEPENLVHGDSSASQIHRRFAENDRQAQRVEKIRRR